MDKDCACKRLFLGLDISSVKLIFHRFCGFLRRSMPKERREIKYVFSLWDVDKCETVNKVI